jgi:hypothetical protein
MHELCRDLARGWVCRVVSLGLCNGSIFSSQGCAVGLAPDRRPICAHAGSRRCEVDHSVGPKFPQPVGAFSCCCCALRTGGSGRYASLRPSVQFSPGARSCLRHRGETWAARCAPSRSMPPRREAPGYGQPDSRLR